ncbi:MAG: radical SAM protein [Campylobacterota bacterium]|nr:radical SAM protein [Campylobacterota bacterium]
MDNIIFGPIPSRRFGMSLGIDLSPNSKQCNFDCLYCELEKAKTVSKQTEIIKVEDIISQLKTALLNHKNIDVITFTANGEPSLYPYLDELIDEVDKLKGDIKTLILSNGANIYQKSIQKTLSKIDIVKLSLDCVSDKCFKKLDRVDSSIQFDKIVDGMVEFRKQYHKQLICECLFVKTLNDSDEEIGLIRDALTKIKPNRVDIGTIDRPPAYDVKPVDYKKLLYIADKFENIPVTIAHRDKTVNIEDFNEEEIITLLKRRPLTQDDIENLFSKTSKKLLETLVNRGKIKTINNNSVKFYKNI